MVASDDEGVCAPGTLKEAGAHGESDGTPKAAGLVLIVDDDRGITETLVAILEYAGYLVATAVDGAALRAARDLRPRLILLDIMMPVMDGVEVSRRLREDPATRSIPIVAMSAQEQLDATAAHMPVDARLAKPFDLDDVLQVVERWARPT